MFFKKVKFKQHEKKMFPPGLKPGTLRVWSARDNHYTTETEDDFSCNLRQLIQYSFLNDQKLVILYTVCFYFFYFFL